MLLCEPSFLLRLTSAIRGRDASGQLRPAACRKHCPCTVSRKGSVGCCIILYGTLRNFRKCRYGSFRCIMKSYGSLMRCGQIGRCIMKVPYPQSSVCWLKLPYIPQRNDRGYCRVRSSCKYFICFWNVYF